ncbi:MAG TPA: UDP-N-acetylmuramoyl-L-alanine--D-glutamate ligase [Allosphingosinicella sp.]|nr:UDP-N-acetylmuramoyl-L-alanine--D-glutamate ligase [Allosphingosinicella sp.]
MIASPAFRGKRYAVLGLARSGLATVEALAASGAEVTAWDNSESVRQSFRSSRAKSRGAGTDSEVRPSTTLGTNDVFVEDFTEIDLAGFDAIVVSPGVPLNTHPIAAKAREAGVPVIGDIELFAQARPSLPPHKVVGITGTNGKSTTTALVHHILKTAGVPTTMGGNIGLPILAQDPLADDGVYVLELSSYQIDLTFSLDCDVAVLLNVTPDHLDRYADFHAYAAAKRRLFEMQSAGHVALVGDEDSIDQSNWPNLQGPHNAQNARAAMAVCEALGLGTEAIAEGLKSYPGLPHRMERIAEKNGVLFINDSKATNADSTAPALAAYPYIHWIVGGRAKSEGLGPCADQLGHVRAAYTIGEAGPMFARLLEGRVPVRRSEVLASAVTEAAGAARSGEVVLLSPACASFDQFRDYEARGDAFRALVGALP